MTSSFFSNILSFYVSTRLKSSKAFSTKEPHGDDTDLIQDHQWRRHHQLIHNIRSRSQDRRDNKINENSILPVTIQKSDIDNTNFGQEDHQYRHLKDNAKGNEQTKG